MELTGAVSRGIVFPEGRPMQHKQEDMAFTNTHRETDVLCQQPISLTLSQQTLTLSSPFLLNQVLCWGWEYKQNCPYSPGQVSLNQLSTS